MNNIFRNQNIQNYLFPFIGGLLYAIGFPMGSFQGIFFAPIIGLALLFLSLNFRYPNKIERPGLSELLSVLIFSLGYCLLGYYWIPHLLNEFGQVPFPFNNALAILFSLIIVPQLLIFVLGKNLLFSFNLKSNRFLKNVNNKDLIYAFALTFLEYYTPQQFPAHLGHPWLSLAPYIGLASIFGAPIFSFISFWMVLVLVKFLKEQVIDKFALICFALFFILNAVIPLNSNKKSDFTMLNIRMVQANIGNFMKVQSESGLESVVEVIHKRYKDLSVAKSSEPIDLIIWPETAFPSLLSSGTMKDFPESVPSIFQQIIAQTNSELFVGGYDRRALTGVNDYQSEYNTAFHFGTNAHFKDSYHKIKLIPFGEGLPFGPFNKFLSGIITNVSYFAAGERFTLFETKKNIPFITQICYEILFSRLTRDYLNSVEKQPRFLINITNDSWYGDTSEPYQHLFLAHWRALEFNIPVFRMTNTGITSVLYPDGSESKRLMIGEEDKLDINFKAYAREKTIFQTFGFSLTILVWLFLLLIRFILNKRSN